MFNKSFPFYKQLDQMDCGPTCLRIILKYYGKILSLQKIKTLCETTRQGTALSFISDAAEKLGFRTLGVKINFKKLEKDALLPCIVYLPKNKHFIVIYKINKKKVYVSDPAYGLIDYKIEEFIKIWIGNNSDVASEEGIVLLLEATPLLEEINNDPIESKKGILFLIDYLKAYKKLFLQLIFCLLGSSILQLIIPFLTQSLIDVGIKNKNIEFIYIIVISQLFIFLGSITIELIRNWILIYIGSRVNITLISDFFIKLMKLPMSFFDTKITGDIIQRINDHDKLKNLLINTPFSALFSIFNFITFSAILIFYSIKLFLIFFFGVVLFILWVTSFLKERKKMDYKLFSKMSEEHSKVIELIQGMQEIKLHNAEIQKRWDWEYAQAHLFRLNIKSLKLTQLQSIGGNIITQSKNLLLSFFAAKLVVNGEITLGMMMSISYIIGQLNVPIETFIGLIHMIQDANIAIERSFEIHNKEDETDNKRVFITPNINSNLKFKNLSFRYKGTENMILKNISLEIPSGKTTAIVGASGSGKTTLLKLLLKFYDPVNGNIELGNVDLRNISQKFWRDNCGVVMQEGHIFNDTIFNNIMMNQDTIDYDLFYKSVEDACIRKFIESLPLIYNTKIGNEGMGLSTGQKQRILIARAIYKNPKFVFFDEATSALDTENENKLIKNLSKFAKKRTMVIIAHRLSTVKNADNIIVMNKGEIAEEGTHDYLIRQKRKYFSLIKNQLQIEQLN